MIEFLLLDLDDTILDFHKAERIALSKTIRAFGAEPTEALLNRYHEINKWYWEQLELGKMTRDQVLVNRFGALFEKVGMTVDPAACAKSYESNLGIGHYFLPGAEEAVKRLKREQQDAVVMGSQNRAWVQVFAQYENVQELDRRLLLALVDKILIYEDKKVEIVFRYRDEFARAMEIAKNYKDRPLPAVG